MSKQGSVPPAPPEVAPAASGTCAAELPWEASHIEAEEGAEIAAEKGDTTEHWRQRGRAEAFAEMREILLGTPAAFPRGSEWRVEHDGFQGRVIGSYLTEEGKPGVVLQQTGTRVVHVYGEKWPRALASGSSAQADGVADELAAAIEYALEVDDGLEWLRAWNEGDPEAMSEFRAARSAAPAEGGEHG